MITNIGLGHVEFLGDEAGVAKEKGSLFEVLPRNGDGLAVMNADDKWCHGIAQPHECDGGDGWD